MRNGSCLKLIMGFTFVGMGAGRSRPTKTFDFADDGKNCDPTTEQYMEIQALDYHDHPKFTVRWRQTTGPCGEAMDESDLVSWEHFYDGSTDDAPDQPPTSGDEGRVKFNLWVCCPYGQYELDLDVESFDDEGTTRYTRVVFQIEHGPNKYHLWDSLWTHLADDVEYAPTDPGEYTWPLEGATGFYKTFIAGPLPPIVCDNSWPAGTEVVGCFEDSSKDRLLSADTLVLSQMGENGMTAQICSDFCSGFDYFGLESGNECFCGTADEFDSAVESDQCGTTYALLCTGDATTACGGVGAMSVYQRTGGVTATPETTYSRKGCFKDSKYDRIMGKKIVKDDMSAEICHELCDNGINTHFGTQFAEECWCAVDPDLTKNGVKLALDECDMPCAGTTTGEFCGGKDKIVAYKIQYVDSP